MTYFRLFQTERLCRGQFQILITIAESSPNGYKTLREKEKLLVSSNFSFPHRVFKRLVLQTHKNQGLFGKELTLSQTSPCFYVSVVQVFLKHCWKRRNCSLQAIFPTMFFLPFWRTFCHFH